MMEDPQFFRPFSSRYQAAAIFAMIAEGATWPPTVNAAMVGAAIGRLLVNCPVDEPEEELLRQFVSGFTGSGDVLLATEQEAAAIFADLADLGQNGIWPATVTPAMAGAATGRLSPAVDKEDLLRQFLVGFRASSDVLHACQSAVDYGPLERLRQLP